MGIAYIYQGPDDFADMNLNDAKLVAHTIRRQMRINEFAPHDDIIAKKIPGFSQQETEAARQAIRDKYAVVQEDIDAAETAEELKQILEDAKTD